MKKLLALILCGLMVLSFSGYAEEGVQDGAYNVVGPGFYGDLDVTVTIADGRIADITVANCPETPELGGRAIEIMTAAMVENNTSGVDSVTGATVTSAFFRRAVNEALKQANAPNAMKAHVEAPEKTAETLDCDVLVMGSGTAGLSAAIAAAEAGASVLVIEKQDIPGGSAVTSAGIVYAPVDEADRDAMVQYYMDRAEGNANQELLQFYADNALDTISWLESLGVQWLMTVPAGTAPEPRARFSMTAEGVGMTGAALVNPMLAKLNALGVQLLCGVKGTELLVDESGAIIGAKAESKAADYTINANSVILATGGFDASKEMKATYSPVAEDDFPLSAKGNVGDGINMGMAIGAATEFKGGVIGFDFVDGSLPASGMNAVAMYCSSYVQPDGTFVSKVIDYPITYTAIKELGVPNFYGLYDAKGADTAEQAVAVGFGWKGDTVEALADATGMDAAKLADAIEQDPDLTEAPYYAVMVKPTTIGSMGGLVIDADAEVLREDGSAIPGLYATGEVANGGFYNVEYPASGSSLSLGMTFGLEAGRNAAARAAAAPVAADAVTSASVADFYADGILTGDDLMNAINAYTGFYAVGSVNPDGTPHMGFYIYSCVKVEETYYLMLGLSPNQTTVNVDAGSELVAMYAALPAEGATYPTSGARMTLSKVTDEALLEVLHANDPQGFTPMYYEITGVRSLG